MLRVRQAVVAYRRRVVAVSRRILRRGLRSGICVFYICVALLWSLPVLSGRVLGGLHAERSGGPLRGTRKLGPRLGPLLLAGTCSSSLAAAIACHSLPCPGRAGTPSESVRDGPVSVRAHCPEGDRAVRRPIFKLR